MQSGTNISHHPNNGYVPSRPSTTPIPSKLIILQLPRNHHPLNLTRPLRDYFSGGKLFDADGKEIPVLVDAPRKAVKPETTEV